ncbi:protein PBDC1-like [Halichondria panicea]|uniref:protein PBDC1-like n=1 Tax=Halichondria panicea TaxID=6063 RepID=UPI00312B72AB
MASLEEQLSALGVEGVQPVGGMLSGAKAEDFENNPVLEQMWAMQAFKYAETHFTLIQSRDAKEFQLTRVDDELYEAVRERFKELKVDVIDVESIKSPAGKEVWRQFCNDFREKVHDFNFATLLRIDSSKEYDEANTVIVPRAQFLAIEVVRNRQGLNSMHSKKTTS